MPLVRLSSQAPLTQQLQGEEGAPRCVQHTPVHTHSHVQGDFAGSWSMIDMSFTAQAARL